MLRRVVTFLSLSAAALIVSLGFAEAAPPTSASRDARLVLVSKNPATARIKKIRPPKYHKFNNKRRATSVWGRGKR